MADESNWWAQKWTWWMESFLNIISDLFNETHVKIFTRFGMLKTVWVNLNWKLLYIPIKIKFNILRKEVQCRYWDSNSKSKDGLNIALRQVFQLYRYESFKKKFELLKKMVQLCITSPGITNITSFAYFLGFHTFASHSH